MPQEECNTIRNGLLGNDPIGFLRNNVVAVCDLDEIPQTETGLAEKTVPTAIIRAFDAVQVNETSDVRVFSLREDMAGHLQARYLPWNPNTGYYIVLKADTDPPLFFTAMLSGCGVGFIEAPDQSAVRFSHHNIKRGLGPDHAALDKSLAFTDAKLHPREYQVDSGKGFAHVHGVMRNKRWRFYVQKIIKQNDHTSEVLEVYELKNQSSFCTIL